MMAEDIFLGPMLRFCDRTFVTIVLASFVPLKLRFSVKQADRNEWLAHDSSPLEIKVSESLYFYFGRVRTGKNQPAFPTLTLLSYGIAVLKESCLKDKPQAQPDAPRPPQAEDSQTVLRGEAPKQEDESGEQELYPESCWDYSFFEDIVDEDQLAYEDFHLPTFFLQDKNNPSSKLNIIHGSCRKPHDLNPDEGGAYDALAFADDLIWANRTDLSRRPAIACFGGDQIYADDVHDDVFDEIALLAGRIEEGYAEKLPDGLSLPAKGERKSFLHENAGIQSGESQNHLITLSEYLAMYGLVWNINNWINRPPELEPFLLTLPAVRRVLANTPSYMIFDDHNVTDDWNLDLNIEEGMRSKPLGFQLIGNALVAFWLCQGYGNNPKAYITWSTGQNHAKDLGNTISARTADQATANYLRTTFWDWFPMQNLWEFATPTLPPVYFLDTRTRRGTHDGLDRFDSNIGSADPKSRVAPVMLKSYEAWKATARKLRAVLGSDDREKLVVLVSATPILGIQLMEWGQKLVGTQSATVLDNEAWSANESGFHFALELFSDSYLVVLSGDVHYSFTSSGRYRLFDCDYTRYRARHSWELAEKPNAPTGEVSYEVVRTNGMLQLNSSGLMNWSNKAVPLAQKLPKALDRINKELRPSTHLERLLGMLGQPSKLDQIRKALIDSPNKYLIETEYDFTLVGDRAGSDFWIFPIQRPDANVPEALASILTLGITIGQELLAPLPLPIPKRLIRPRSMLEQEVGSPHNSGIIIRHALAVTSFQGLRVTNYFLTDNTSDSVELSWDLSEIQKR